MPSDITPLAHAEMSDSEVEKTRRELLKHGPDLIADDGAQLLRMVHEEFPKIAASVIGACEQTTCGITRLQAMANNNALAFPVYDVNSTPMKRSFDNVHGTAESSLTALASVTNAMIAGSVVVIVGYGYCGRGIVRGLQTLGAHYYHIADTMDADQYSRETFVNHVTEQSTYGVLDFERRGKGRGKGVHMYFSLSEDPETILETIREDSRFANLAHEDATISAVVREHLKKFHANS